MRAFIVLALFTLALAPAGAASRPAAHPFLDLDFEAPECSGSWVQGTTGQYELSIDDSQPHSGRQSLEIRYATPRTWASTSWAAVAQDFPVAAATGKTLRLSAFLRTAGITAGTTQLFAVAVDEQGNDVTTAGLQEEAPRGDTPWTPYTIELAVPTSAREVYFGFELAGNGAAWIDGVSLQVDGRPWADGKPALTPPNRQALSWLRKQAIPFATVEAGNGFDDLQRLKKVIGDARVVSLGEQTHGTREFFQMKHRLVEFLASEMGFTLFAIEANMPEAYQVDRYVLTGQGDPRELLKGMYFWTWNTQEVLDMILWMRDFNQSGRGRIQFLGFDMQATRVAAIVVRDFLAKVDSGYSGHAMDLMNRVNAASDRGTASAADLAAAQELFDHLQQSRDSYLSRLSRDEVDWGLQNARILLQDMQLLTGTVSRDESMAANVSWILDQNPDAKIVLWAHNGHVAKAPGAMGSYLAGRYGDQAVSLGFAFDQGSYNARDFIAANGRVVANEALPPSPNSVEAYLRSAGLPRFVLDLRHVPAGGASTWLKQPRPFREIGAVALRCASPPTVIADTFDGLVWIDRTSPSVLLPFQ